MPTAASSRPSGTRSMVVVIGAVFGLAVMVSGCSSEPDSSPSSAASGALAEQGDYGYGSDSFTACLDANGISYRSSTDGGLQVVGTEDPAVQLMVDDCQTATTMPASAELTAYQNTVTAGIADCLVEAGYHVNRSADSEMTDGEGRSTTTFSVPQAERDLAAYTEDLNRCTDSAAAAAGPAPQPNS